MAAQPLAFGKGGRQVAHHRFFAGGQAVGIGGIDGGQRHGPERVDTAAQRNAFAVFRQQVQQPAALHAVFGMPRDELPFQLEQNDRYSLKRRLRLRKARIVLAGKQCQRPQADAIAGFQQLHVVILQASAHDGGHAHGVAGGRAHPQDIMVAPFDVHGMVISKRSMIPSAWGPRS